jgi:hypothetical protein
MLGANFYAERYNATFAVAPCGAYRDPITHLRWNEQKKVAAAAAAAAAADVYREIRNGKDLPYVRMLNDSKRYLKKKRLNLRYFVAYR